MSTSPSARAVLRRLLFAAAIAVPLTVHTRPVAAQTTEARDTVVLTNGKELRGRVLRIDEKELVLRVGSVDRTIARDQVKSIAAVAIKHRQLIGTWQNVAADDPVALLAFARRADSLELPHEARLARWHAALLRPGDAAIHELLGNRAQRGGFLVELGGKWVPFGKADALGEDFANAWQLRSEHFAIRCAAGLRAAVNTLLELEAMYWMFHDLFGTALQLQELVEPIEVRVYRTREQMPNLTNTAGAYFSVDEQALFTYFSGSRPFALEHEATHALLYGFFERATKSRGRLPGWLDEGWAEYMLGRITVRVPGKATLLERSVLGDHQALLASIDKGDLYGVHRLLNFKNTDFMASSRQDAKYAQAWALFRHLFEHRDPAVHGLFVEYLREATRGQGQASTFRRIFARHEKDLETEPWKR